MTSAPDHRYQEEDAEQLLGALAGVVSAHIVADDAGRMVEIHILATPELHPKQVVRNVESALSAGLGIQIDRRMVSVAQIRQETANGRSTPADSGDPVPAIVPPDPPATPATKTETTPDRLEYVRYESHRDVERCTCRVVLRSNEGEVTGTGAGPDTAAGRAEAAARAVFDALGRAHTDLRVELEGAVIADSRGRSYVIVSAHILLDRSTVPLVGAGALNRSPEEAAILAALQASNRWSG